MKFRMPLFFFISGYFAYNFNYTSKLLKQRTLNRINRQLFTTIIFWISYCILFVCSDLESFIRLPFVSDKNGYWFTFVSVEFFFMFAPILWLFCKYKFSRQRQTLILLLLVVMFAVVYGISRYFPSVYHKGALFSIYHVLKYGIYFIIGMLYKLNESRIKQAVTNIYSCLFYLTLSIAILFFNPIHSFIINEVLVAGLLIAFIFSAASNIYKSKTVNNSYFTTFMVYIGQMTLEIYLLHYFVIAFFKTTNISHYLEPHINKWSEFPVFLSISLVILATCIGFVFILKKINLYKPIFKASFIS